MTSDYLFNIPADMVCGENGRYCHVYIEHAGPNNWYISEVCFEDMAALTNLTNAGGLFMAIFYNVKEFVQNYYRNQDSILTTLQDILQRKEAI